MECSVAVNGQESRYRCYLPRVGVQPETKWIIAEGADGCKLHRSIPMEKAIDNIVIAYAQNGEAIRPEQGYPLRLVVPGWEGNTHVKWLRRIKAVDQPYMGREETSKYTDLMPDGKARQFTFVMEAKSVITFPSGRDKLPGPGFYEITGLAWSGRGLIESFEVSIDGGQSWLEAQFQEPRHPVALTRFRLPWRWEGQEVTLRSRCIDRNGLRSAQPRSADRGSWPEHEISLQRHHGLESLIRRERSECLCLKF